jgi:hypothetical protein
MAEHGPELAAQLAPEAAPPVLTTRIGELVEHEQREPLSRTGEVQGDHIIDENVIRDGQRVYRLVVLSHRTSDGYAITGVAALIVDAEQQFTQPGPLAAQLSRLLLEAGDVMPLLSD